MQGTSFLQSSWLISVLFAVLQGTEPSLAADWIQSPSIEFDCYWIQDNWTRALEKRSSSWSPSTICQVGLGVLHSVTFESYQLEDVSDVF